MPSVCLKIKLRGNGRVWIIIIKYVQHVDTFVFVEEEAAAEEEETAKG